ncbi:MAG: flagellar export chaperone FliS [Verrucomicrobiota bacterium]
MNYSNLASKSYKTASISTVSPGKLILMLYDGALKFMHEAELGFRDKHFVRRNEIVNNNLIKAQKIINELQNSLDLSVQGDLPKTLNDLYEYCFNRLEIANVQKRPQAVKEAYAVISDLRSAWADMLQKQNSTEQPASPTQRPASTANSAGSMLHSA